MTGFIFKNFDVLPQNQTFKRGDEIGDTEKTTFSQISIPRRKRFHWQLLKSLLNYSMHIRNFSILVCEIKTPLFLNWLEIIVFFIIKKHFNLKT